MVSNSNIEYWFEEDYDQINKIASKLDENKAKRFGIEQSQRLFVGHEENLPQIFNIKYRTRGSITNYLIFEQAIQL